MVKNIKLYAETSTNYTRAHVSCYVQRLLCGAETYFRPGRKIDSSSANDGRCFAEITLRPNSTASDGA